MNIYLIGYRGTGKTTVAALVADSLQWRSIDTDVLIEAKAKRSIKQVFDSEGESGFRELESLVVNDVARETQTVVALGGGAILRGENRELIKHSGKTVWLRADSETIHRRVSADPATYSGRPNLTATGGLAEIEKVLTGRTPIYSSCADFEVDTTDKSPRQIANEIVSLLTDNYSWIRA